LDAEWPAELQPVDRRLRQLRARRRQRADGMLEYRFFLSAQNDSLHSALTSRGEPRSRPGRNDAAFAQAPEGGYWNSLINLVKSIIYMPF
jgi:hypothetical protein